MFSHKTSLFKVIFLGITFSHSGFASTQIILKAPYIATTKIFDVDFEWRSNSLKNTKKITSFIESDVLKYNESFDPECIWRKLVKGVCIKPKGSTSVDAINLISEQIRIESQGIFNVQMKVNNKIKRDFGGIAQGFVLEKIKNKIHVPWLGNLSGDIFYSGGFDPQTHFILPNPVLPSSHYAVVEMKSGWMMSTYGNFDGTIRIHKSGSNTPLSNTPYISVTLFAKPEFNGARADAWTKAILIGGPNMIQRLSLIREFQNQWAWLTFDNSGKINCSELLRCNLDVSKDFSQRKVIVPW